MNNKSVFAILLVAVILVFMFSQTQLGIISPGFEGAKCYGYGADFRFTDQAHSTHGSWEGTYQLHKYQDAEPWLCRKGQAATGQWWDRIVWGTTATPNDVGVSWEYASGIISNRRRFPDLSVHVESNIQLEDVNRQGDPLGWNLTDPSSGKRIEYWSKTAVKEETADKVIYHYTLTKESFIVAPAEFWIGFYLVPSQNDAGTGSGWREGEWQNIVDWFMLDWTVWDNAYYDVWLDDPEVNVFDTLYDGYVTNKERTWDYRGGFPIAGFIKGWETAGWTSAPEYQESPQWYETRGKESDIYTIEELADLKDKLMAKCSFAPSLMGQFLSLYDSPDSAFSYELSDTDFSNEALTSGVKTPSSEMKKTMYFPINIQNFGTYADPTDFILGVPTGWRVFYPSCYFRIRMLYGVYGTFTYLWTEELAKDPTVNYPEEPEHHGTTVIHTPGIANWFTGVTDWFGNILGNLLQWMLSIAVIMAVAVIVISIIKRKKGGDGT